MSEYIQPASQMRFICDKNGCLKDFRGNYELGRHQDEQHQEPKKCPWCPKTAKRGSRLWDHMEKAHPRSRNSAKSVNNGTTAMQGGSSPLHSVYIRDWNTFTADSITSSPVVSSLPPYTSYALNARQQNPNVLYGKGTPHYPPAMTPAPTSTVDWGTAMTYISSIGQYTNGGSGVLPGMEVLNDESHLNMNYGEEAPVTAVVRQNNQLMLHDAIEETELPSNLGWDTYLM